LKIVNFGCGPSPAGGVDNVDGSPIVLLAHLPLPAAAFGSRRDFVAAIRAHGIRFGLGASLSFPEHSLDGFYAPHALEHMARTQCVSLLSRVRRWLRPAGVLRVALPDLRRFMAAYATGESDADVFVSRLGLAIDGRRWWSVAFGHSYHRWMYDVASLCRLLAELGYGPVRECAYGEGRVPEVARLDLPERRAESFYVEAQP
jgi:hypothetical protein